MASNISDLPIRDLQIAIDKRFSTNSFFIGNDKDVDNSYNKKDTMFRSKDLAITLVEIKSAMKDSDYISFIISGNLTCMQFAPMYFLSNKFKKEKQTGQQEYFDRLKLGARETYSANYPTVTFQYVSPYYNFDREEGVITSVEIIEDFDYP